MWAVLENGYGPDGYAQQFPKTVDHAIIAFGAAGYGCQPHATPQGVETYFSWIYDRLNVHLDLPAPLLMHTIAFPGTEWDLSQRHEHLSQKTDAYHIRYHPAVLSNAIDAWLSDARRMLPSNVRSIDAAVLAHSYGGRALTAHLAEIGGGAGAENASSRLATYLADLAQRSGFDRVKMHPVFLSPAYALNPETSKLLRLAVPLEMVDSGVKHLPVGTVYSRYQSVTQKPFKWVADTVFKHPQLAGKLVGTDNTGRFMLDFARVNDPHILLPQGRQLETTLMVAPHFNRALRQADGWNPLVISGEQDRLISNAAIDSIHGDPDSTGNYHVRVAGMTHIECLQDPESIARLIAARLFRGRSA
ncbi:MAG: hypothetical protein IPK16_13840 [Anaerolineales bacterium]|nr:hypothetical protein [Anaerolineales bacterium]